MERRLVKDLDDLRVQIGELPVEIPISEDLTPLANQVKVGKKATPNAIAVHPMEGADGTGEGSPAEFTFRRYKRFAAGGAGLVWTEAVAVVDEGRANPRQLFLHSGTKDEFRRLVEEIKQIAQE